MKRRAAAQRPGGEVEVEAIDPEPRCRCVCGLLARGEQEE
jgi:hypothetical protein